MSRRALSLAMLLSLLLSGVMPAAVGAAEAPLPDSMAAVGDSITQAASTGGTLGADYPANAWSTGTNSTVNSHYLRLLAAGAAISGENHNRSVSGAKMFDLDAQMANVVALQPDYVTVLIGGNDLCTDTVEQMTLVSSFRAQFEAAMSRVMTGTSAHVYVVSIPDVYQLWELFKGNFWARFIWSSADICQSLLANPTSTQKADVDRRAAVRQRNIEYNTQLDEVCALHRPRCRFDGNAVFSTRFTTNDVSGDYFHPSLAGQAKLSAVSWGAGYTWATAPPPPNVAPTAGFTSSCADLTCSFTDASSDSDGTIASRSWTFGDGTTSTATNPQRTYAAAGTYTVSLTVTDDDGATGSTSGSVTVTAPPAPTPMWVGGLAPSTTSARNSWTARVTISVTDGAPVSGVLVTGSWTAGSGTSSCTTSAAGTCQVSVTLDKKTTSTTYTVSGLAKSGWTYQPGSNTATSVSLAKP